MGSGVGSGAKMENRYERAMEAAGGDEEKAKEAYAVKFLGMTPEQIEAAKKEGSFGAKLHEGGWNSGRDSSKENSAKLREERFEKYVSANATEGKTREDLRKEFDQKVEIESMASKYPGASGQGVGAGMAPSITAGRGSPEVEDAIRRASSTYGIPFDIMYRMAILESNLDPNASRGAGGAKGLYQFIPETAKAYGIAGMELNPYANAEAAAKLFLANKKDLEARGIPFTTLTAYLSHQQGAAGLANVWNAAFNGGVLSKGSIERMQNNDPFGQKQARDPKVFIAAWQKKIEGENTILPGVDVSSVKVHSAISGSMPQGAALLTAGIPQQASSSAVYVPQSPATVASTAAQAEPIQTLKLNSIGAEAMDVTSRQLQVPTGADLLVRSKMDAMPPEAVPTTPVEAVAAAADGNSMNAAAAASGVSTPIVASAAENVSAMHESASTVATAMQPATKEDALLAELKSQTSLLSTIAGNTENVGASVTAGISNILNSNHATPAVKEVVAEAPKKAASRLSDFFGNFLGGGDEPAVGPSKASLLIASGGNLIA